MKSALKGQGDRVQQIGYNENGEPYGVEVHIVGIEIKEGVADEDMKRRKFEDKGMILIGNILCPLKIG